jgi:hypothetical protein
MSIELLRQHMQVSAQSLVLKKQKKPQSATTADADEVEPVTTSAGFIADDSLATQVNRTKRRLHSKQHVARGAAAVLAKTRLPASYRKELSAAQQAATMMLGARNRSKGTAARMSARRRAAARKAKAAAVTLKPKSSS